MSAVRASPPLQQLSVTVTEWSCDDQRAMLSALKRTQQHLKQLFLCSSSICDRAFKNIAALTKLTVLSIGSEASVLLVPPLEQLTALQNLEALYITHADLMDEDIVALQHLVLLKTLCLKYCDFCGQAISAALFGLSNLLKLHLIDRAAHNSDGHNAGQITAEGKGYMQVVILPLNELNWLLCSLKTKFGSLLLFCRTDEDMPPRQQRELSACLTLVCKLLRLFSAPMLLHQYRHHLWMPSKL